MNFLKIILRDKVIHLKGINGYSLEIILNCAYGTYDLAGLTEEQAEELLKEFKSRDLTEW